MPSRDAARRWLPALAIGIALLVVGWRVLTLGLADHYASSDPDRALYWRPDHPEALLRFAEREAQDGDLEAAERAARRALAVDPLDGRAFRVLGHLRDRAGRPEEAIRFFELAIARTPRDLAAQARLADHHLAQGDFPNALARLDTMMRVSPDLIPKLVPPLTALAGHPVAAESFADRLARMPPWRVRVMREIIKAAPESLAVAPLLDTLRQRSGGLTETELAAWVDRLVADGHVGKAYLTWVALLPEEKRQRLGNVYNGGFEAVPGQGGFDWRFGRVRGARIDRMHEPGATGSYALRIAFEDRRVPFAHVSQMLALPPGKYGLSGRVRPDQLRTERGLSWQLACIGGHRGELLATDPVRGNGPWRDFTAEFEIPGEGCEGQWLRLRHTARIEAEQRIGGRVWFDDIRITRLR